MVDSSPIEHVREMLASQVAKINEHEPGTRAGAEPEDLHQMRVATRRARAILRAARPLLDPGWADGLRAELKWLGSALGDVRDLDVLLTHVRREADRLGGDDAFAAKRIVHALEAERERARGGLLETLESERYAQLLERLADAGHAPALDGAGVELPELAAHQFVSLRKSASKLNGSSSDADLHRARVKAKRARYASELAESAVGKRAARFTARAKRFQDVVGEHQDAVVAEEKLRMAVASVRGNKVALAAGRLVERQRERRAEAREALPKAWAKLERAGRRAWS